MNIQTVFLSVLLLLVTGCTVGPNYQKPDLRSQLPAQYQQIDKNKISTAPVTDRWWLTFNDAAINQLVDSALISNLDLATASANIRQARAQLRIAESALKPQLSAEGRVNRDLYSKNSELFANIPFPNPQINFTDYRAQLDASWQIDLFGLTARSVEGTRARLASVEDQRETVVLSVAAEVAMNVINYRAWQLRSKNAEAILADSQQLLELITLQKKAGLISDSDLTDAQTAAHNAAAAIPSLQTAAVASIMALTVLTDQTQEQVAAILQTSTEIPSVPKQVDSLGVPSNLLLRRPDLRSAEQQLAAATADIGVAVAQRYPQLTLVGDIGLDSITPGKFVSLASRFWNVGPQVAVPIFNGGRLAAQVRVREAARDAALANYRQAVLTAFADTETALIRFQREQQRFAQINQALASQRRQLEFSKTRYQLGDTSYTNVLQGRQQLAQLNDLQLASQQALAENLTALFKSLGGGIQ